MRLGNGRNSVLSLTLAGLIHGRRARLPDRLDYEHDADGQDPWQEQEET